MFNLDIIGPLTFSLVIPQGLLAIFVGISIGVFWGVLSDILPDHSDIYAPAIRSLLIFGGGVFLTYAGGYIGWGGTCEYLRVYIFLFLSVSSTTE